MSWRDMEEDKESVGRVDEAWERSFSQRGRAKATQAIKTTFSPFS